MCQYSVLSDVDKPIDIEAIWLTINCIITCLIYIPPRVQFSHQIERSEYVVKTFDSYTAIHTKHSIILLGDFNCFDTDFIVSQLSLSMIISDATRGSSILDKVFVSKPVVRFEVNVLDPLSSSDHNKISISFDLPVEYQYQYREVYDFRNSFLLNFADLIRQANFNSMLKSKSIDEKVDIFYNIVKVSMKFIPKKRVKISTKDKQWITPVLKLLITKSWNAFWGKNIICTTIITVSYTHLTLPTNREV